MLIIVQITGVFCIAAMAVSGYFYATTELNAPRKEAALNIFPLSIIAIILIIAVPILK
jgi:hypothetical protein